MRHGGLTNLPSEHTLSDYTQWISPNSGVHLHSSKSSKGCFADEVHCGQQHVAVSMDEMKLKSVWCLTSTLDVS